MPAYPLDQIYANPWQPRTAENENNVHELAEDLRRNGLLQPPTARPHPTKAGSVQLAFGHRRRSAWAIAYPEQPMPLIIVELTDRQMSDIAAAENSSRQDLTAMEKARAIKRRMSEFKLSQLEAGAPFGYASQGAVANLLALLQLPDPIQACVAAGELPERHARQLVKLAKVAPKDTERLAKEIAKAAPEKRDATLSDGMLRLIENNGREFSGQAYFELSWPASPIMCNDTKELITACTRCQYLFGHDFETTCTNPACFDNKNKVFAQIDMDQAITQLKISKLAKGEKGHQLAYSFESRIKTPAQLSELASKHPELGLRLEQQKPGWHSNTEISGFESVEVVTLHPQAVEDFFKTNSLPKVKPVAAAGTKQDKERAARAAHRASRLRAIEDIKWIILNAIEFVHPQLHLSGFTLAYVLARHSKMENMQVAQLFGFQLLEQEWSRAAEKSHSDNAYRKVFLLREICWNCLCGIDYQLAKPDGGVKRALNELHKDLENFITTTTYKDAFTLRQQAGLGAKLPLGWDKPPIHHTAYNCWTCGTFAGNTRLTKKDQADGWITDASGRVTCPHCATDQQKLEHWAERRKVAKAAKRTSKAKH